MLHTTIGTALVIKPTGRKGILNQIGARCSMEDQVSFQWRRTVRRLLSI